VPPEKVAAYLQTFVCARNPDIEDFLHRKAIEFEQRHAARTYLLTDIASPQVLAYFTLTFKEIELSDEVSGNQRRALDGFSKHAQRIKAFLIGQLGKNDGITNNSLRLGTILDEGIYPIIAQAQDLIGGRVVLLECENTTGLIELYQKAGYKHLQTLELVQLFRVM